MPGLLIVRVRQNALLAEIIKVNAPSPAVLLEVITRYGMTPRLEEVPLPYGALNPDLRNLTFLAEIPDRQTA